VIYFSYWSIKFGFITVGKLIVVLIIPSSWGFPTGPLRHQDGMGLSLPSGRPTARNLLGLGGVLEAERKNQMDAARRCKHSVLPRGGQWSVPQMCYLNFGFGGPIHLGQKGDPRAHI
jgi:hypothetical protein